MGHTQLVFLSFSVTNSSLVSSTSSKRRLAPLGIWNYVGKGTKRVLRVSYLSIKVSV